MSVLKADRRAPVRSQRPKASTVFAAAFLAGAAAAVGLNRTLDVHLAQRQPRVESEPIFVALRSLPQGVPVTVWDVALRDWPKAMLPAAAMRPRDTFEGMVLKHPLREGQPILSVQLAKAATADSGQMAAASSPSTASTAPVEPTAPQSDLWAPAEVPVPAAAPAEAQADAQIHPETSTEIPTELHAEIHAENSTEIRAENSVEIPAEILAQSPAVAAPVISEPVVVASSSPTDIEPAAPVVASVADTVSAHHREPAMRYLVVPERIALEADRSFVQLPDETPQAGVPETDAAQTTARKTTAPESTALTTPRKASTPSLEQGRTARQVERTSSSRDRQPQRPPRSAAGQTGPARAPEKTSLLRSMMPGMSLGMGAVEPAPAAQAPSGSNADQAQRPVFRGWGIFR